MTEIDPRWIAARKFKDELKEALPGFSSAERGRAGGKPHWRICIETLRVSGQTSLALYEVAFEDGTDLLSGDTFSAVVRRIQAELVEMGPNKQIEILRSQPDDKRDAQSVFELVAPWPWPLDPIIRAYISETTPEVLTRLDLATPMKAAEDFEPWSVITIAGKEGFISNYLGADRCGICLQAVRRGEVARVSFIRGQVYPLRQAPPQDAPGDITQIHPNPDWRIGIPVGWDDGVRPRAWQHLGIIVSFDGPQGTARVLFQPHRPK